MKDQVATPDWTKFVWIGVSSAISKRFCFYLSQLYVALAQKTLRHRHSACFTDSLLLPIRRQNSLTTRDRNPHMDQIKRGNLFRQEWSSMPIQILPTLVMLVLAPLPVCLNSKSDKECTLCRQMPFQTCWRQVVQKDRLQHWILSTELSISRFFLKFTCVDSDTTVHECTYKHSCLQPFILMKRRICPYHLTLAHTSVKGWRWRFTAFVQWFYFIMAVVGDALSALLCLGSAGAANSQLWRCLVDRGCWTVVVWRTLCGTPERSSGGTLIDAISQELFTIRAEVAVESDSASDQQLKFGKTLRISSMWKVLIVRRNSLAERRITNSGRRRRRHSSHV